MERIQEFMHTTYISSPQVQMWVTITLLNNKEKIADIDGNGLVYKVFGLYTKEGFLLELSLT